MPVEITGLSEVPVAGDLFDTVDDERKAREIAEQRQPGQPVVTRLEGRLVDQSALQGVLDTLFMLRFRLLRVDCTES